MKKQIAKSISILSLLVLLSVGTVNVSAFPSGSCTGVGCRPLISASAPDVPKALAPDPGGRETVPAAQPENSLSFTFFLVQWAMRFWYLL
jgi:hypothetical protein